MRHQFIAALKALNLNETLRGWGRQRKRGV